MKNRLLNGLEKITTKTSQLLDSLLVLQPQLNEEWDMLELLFHKEKEVLKRKLRLSAMQELLLLTPQHRSEKLCLR
jgi:hypothetical protein